MTTDFTSIESLQALTQNLGKVRSRDLIDAAAALEHVTGESVVQRIGLASLQVSPPGVQVLAGDASLRPECSPNYYAEDFNRAKGSLGQRELHQPSPSTLVIW